MWYNDGLPVNIKPSFDPAGYKINRSEGNFPLPKSIETSNEKLKEISPIPKSIEISVEKLKEISLYLNQ